MIKHQLLVAVFACIATAGWSQDKEIIVESFLDGSNSSGFSAVQGNWSESTGKSTAPGLTATKSVYNDANAEAGVARFTPEIPVAGKYEIFITYPIQGNASKIKYNVVSADGAKEVVLTQNGRDLSNLPLANDWYSIGIFNFNAGSTGYVEVADPLTGEKPHSNEPNARIYADAVKFVPSTGAVSITSAAIPTAPAVAAVENTDMPGLPAVQAAATPETQAALPSLPSSTPPAAPAAQLPSLPATSDAVSSVGALPTLPGSTTTPAPAAADMPTLPSATPAPATAGMPSLPTLPSATPAPAVADMPTLPSATPGLVEALPSLPASDSATAQAGLPSLPSASAASTPAASATLPDLPSAQGVVTTQTTIVTTMATPYPVPNLPSLAPVTPTPERTMPSPADTPISGALTGLPGGPLSNMPPMPAVPQPPPATSPAFAMPSSMPDATAMPAVAGTPAPFGINSSITQYNPANLQWMFDFGAALNTARGQSKNVMVFFTAPGNKAANTYETSYFADPSVRQALDRYVLVKVDFPKNTRLGYSLGIFGAGIIVVTNPAGDVTARITQLPPTPLDLVKQMAGEKPVLAVPTPGATGAPAALTVPAPDGTPAAMPPVMDSSAIAPPATGAPAGLMPASAAPTLPPMPGAPAATPASGLPELPGLPGLPGAPAETQTPGML